MDINSVGKTTTTIKVGSFNCQGLNDYHKRIAVFEMLKNSDLSIVFLQETKLKPEYESQYVNEWHNHNCIFNSTSGGKSGTAILINVNYISLLYNRLCDVEGRVIAIDASIKGDIVHLVNSYGPNEHHIKIPFLNRLYVYLSSNKPTIWGGDHNIATDPVLDRYPTRLNHDHGSFNFQNILSVFDLVDSCRVLFPNQKLYSFRRGVAKSRIDKILVSSNMLIAEYLQHETSFSDHQLISITLQHISNQVLGKGVWRNNTKYYEDESFISRFQSLWDNKVLDFERGSNLQKWWMTVKYNFKTKSIQFAKDKVLLKKREIQMKEQGLHNLILLMNQNPDSIVLAQQYNALKKRVNDAKIVDIKEKLFKEDAMYLMHGDKPTKAFFDKYKNKSKQNYIKGLKNENGELMTDISGMLRIAENFYSNLCSGHNSPIQQSVIDFFLNYIGPNQDCKDLMKDLMSPILKKRFMM